MNALRAYLRARRVARIMRAAMRARALLTRRETLERGPRGRQVNPGTHVP